MAVARMVFTWYPSPVFFFWMPRRQGEVPRSPARSGDWTRRCAVVEWAYPKDGKEERMAGTIAIQKKIGKIEGQLKKRVRSLEKDLVALGRKLEKKETEVKKLKEKMTAAFVKDVKKQVKKAKKTVKKRIARIF
jgi:hypothetical protein